MLDYMLYMYNRVLLNSHWKGGGTSGSFCEGSTTNMHAINVEENVLDMFVGGPLKLKYTS